MHERVRAIHRQTGLISVHDYRSQYHTVDVPRIHARAGYNYGLVHLFSRKASLELFGGIVRNEVGVFHPCIAMPNLQV